MRQLNGVPLALTIALFALAACGDGGETEGVRVDVTVAPDPPRVGPATFTVSLSDTAGQPLPGAEVRLEANMTHPGMQPVYASTQEVAAGRYRGDLRFTMAGDWFVVVTGRLADRRLIQQQVEIPGIRPAP